MTYDELEDRAGQLAIVQFTIDGTHWVSLDEFRKLTLAPTYSFYTPAIAYEVCKELKNDIIAEFKDLCN